MPAISFFSGSCKLNVLPTSVARTQSSLLTYSTFQTHNQSNGFLRISKNTIDFFKTDKGSHMKKGLFMQGAEVKIVSGKKQHHLRDYFRYDLI